MSSSWETLIGADSSMTISGEVVSTFKADQITDALITSSGLSLGGDTLDYKLDSLGLAVLIGPDLSELKLFTDDLKGVLEANFDINQAPDLAMELWENLGEDVPMSRTGNGKRKLDFDLQLDAGETLYILSDQIDTASYIHVSGGLDESEQSMELNATTGKFRGFGLALDSLSSDLTLDQGNTSGKLSIDNIYYQDLSLGNLDYQLEDQDSMLHTNLMLKRDSTVLFATNSRISLRSKLAYIYLDQLVALEREFITQPGNPVIASKDNLEFNRFTLIGDAMEVEVNGTIDELELLVRNADLTELNHLFANDSVIITHGKFNGLLAFVSADKKFHLQTDVDSLMIKDSPPIDIKVRAKSENGIIPVRFSLNSSINNLDLTGSYNIDQSEIDASLNVDITEFQMFEFLLPENVEQLNGKVKGQIDIGGSLNAPKYQGELHFQSVDLVTSRPKSVFHIEDEILTLNNSTLSLQDFTILDQWQHPLVLNGSLVSTDYRDYEYDLSIKTDNYHLIDNPYDEQYELQGELVIGADIQVDGNQQDLQVKAAIEIRDSTELTYIVPQPDLVLYTNEGIVEFVDPFNMDSVVTSDIQSVYDSILSTLPSFNLNSTVVLDENAVLTVVVDENSGDFVQLSGTSDLEILLDRTQNLKLNGRYTITKGFYQLSFYNLVKKRFEISAGSSVTWTGNPQNGILDIKATQIIQTSSTGLIGHEVAEAEQSMYRRTLPYEVGIIIKGDLQNPEVSFSLDLPIDERVNYPSLANKLDRLKQPEFESELNRQVFGLLVLGGFIPESGAGVVDESLIAATTLSNSVNAILSSQLNRFANQVIKGVDIDVGLQSYSDFSTGSGQTRTAMDFRVTKRMMNDRLSVEVGGGMDINSDQSGAYRGGDNFRGDITVIYDLTESGNKQLKLFNNETYDIIYHEIRNTGISLIFIREFDRNPSTTNP